jgi:hypothetical protein
MQLVNAIYPRGDGFVLPRNSRPAPMSAAWWRCAATCCNLVCHVRNGNMPSPHAVKPALFVLPCNTRSALAVPCVRRSGREGVNPARTQTQTQTGAAAGGSVRGQAAAEMRAVRAFALTRLCGPIGGVDGADNHRLKVALLRDRAQLQVEHLRGSVGRG